MITKKTMLKVKIKSLALESKIIRNEEKNAKQRCIRDKLYCHRVNAVRNESRLSQLAYGFLNGKEYQEIEQKTKKPINFKRLKSLVSKFGAFYCWNYDTTPYKEYQKNSEEQTLRLNKWIERAESYIARCSSNRNTTKRDNVSSSSLG